MSAASILLYAGEHPVFVVDAYAKRILQRHGWANRGMDHVSIRCIFERQLPPDSKQFNEFHAPIVPTGKRFCRAHDPLCGECPLGRYREEGR